MIAAYHQNFAPTEPPKGYERVEELYRLFFNLMLYLSSQRFKVPETDAESLIHEVFLSFLAHSSEVRDPRAWLVGSICHASRHYWRGNGRTESISDEVLKRADPSAPELADTVATRILVQELLFHLHEKCRHTLRLKYFEGCSAIEVARELETTPRYAEKLIRKCLKRAHQIYLDLKGNKR
ncbi:MAG TPA: sigma-70 family RNA polymerase sigma factor [Thermoanaerobaculia bacterium]|nr:sigma-70 family RNA polymerase sigma factor [Thermoanaerobaculia bacterium]